MPIAANVIQRRMAEVGRIRMGEKVPTKAGGSRPGRLEHFRLTSHAKTPLDAVAAVYGGEVEPWEAETGRQWQVTITADAIDVLIAPGEAFTQWFELWKGGGCERRCDGIRLETFRGKDVRDDDADCLCPADTAERVDLATKGEACKPTSRLSVWLPKVPGLGVWRAETHGFYAAAELPATVGFLQALYAQGYRVAAEMRIGTRTVKRPGQPTKTFPVLELDAPTVRIEGVLDAGVRLPGEGALIAPGELAQLAAGADVKQIGPGAPLEPNESPTGPFPSPREKRPRPGTGTPPALPAQSDMRKTTAAAVRAETRPDPRPAAAPRAIVDDGADEAAAEARQSGSMDALPFGTDDEPPAPAAPLASSHPDAQPPEEAPHPGGEPLTTRVVVATDSGDVDAATGEVLTAAADDDWVLSPEAFKGMVRGAGIPPAFVMDVYRELFPNVGDPRDLDDVQRGKVYVTAVTRHAAQNEGGQA